MATISSTVSLKWISATLMAGMDSRGRTVVIGADRESQPEWLGLKASDLLMLAAASCSTYDVASIMQKQREPLEDLTVTCTGEQDTEPPNTFKSLHLHYHVKGAVSREKLERAINLSEDKYCSVINTLRPTVTITHDYEISN